MNVTSRNHSSVTYLLLNLIGEDKRLQKLFHEAGEVKVSNTIHSIQVLFCVIGSQSNFVVL